MTDPPPSLGRRVPSLSQLHNLEDMVGSSLASAIDTLTLDADSTENGVANALGRNVSTAPPNSAPATETAYGTWQTLLKFAQDLESRALILLNVESVLVEGLCSECLAFGSLKYLETEFQQTFGVVFLAYQDLRSAEAAFRSLGERLSNGTCTVAVHYCVSLDAAVSPKEHTLLVRNVPGTVRDEEVRHLFACYGQLRSLQKEMAVVAPMEASSPPSTYTIVFFSSEDAKRAAFELSTSLPWHPSLKVEFAKQSEHDERSSRQLFALLINWRKEVTLRMSPSSAYSSSGPPPELSKSSSAYSPMQVHHASAGGQYLRTSMVPSNGGRGGSLCASPMDNSPEQMMYPARSPITGPGFFGPQNVNGHYLHRIDGGQPTERSGEQAGNHQFRHSTHPQSALFADAPSFGSIAEAPPNLHSLPPHQMTSHMGFTRVQCFPSPHHIPPQPSHTPVFANSLAPHEMGGGTHRHVRPGPTAGSGGGGGGDGDFSLSMEAVMQGLDRRTTLMIRNIPNKYSQTAVLQEINEQFFGTFDFFYLPIDFKNKCNVGYAFINFIEYRDIVPFFCKYNGRRWNNFNSEKVCAITYARIQGKAAMICRFQNSSLMEKDGEYRPLLFQSSGSQRGKPEQFPPAPPKQHRNIQPGAGTRRGASNFP